MGIITIQWAAGSIRHMPWQQVMKQKVQEVGVQKWLCHRGYERLNQREDHGQTQSSSLRCGCPRSFDEGCQRRKPNALSICRSPATGAVGQLATGLSEYTGRLAASHSVSGCGPL
ncbi:hypothetical protein TREES_T100014785 [Tupaia chinensis]|uniref:Uncharacterized protein n=1 Tax=Tupaia chinensis TaxID=246437 RepID=L9KUS1_TUPCH|nr:hypothetical protein TREES_T100014785 [Tupaia chinensis]